MKQKCLLEVSVTRRKDPRVHAPGRVRMNPTLTANDRYPKEVKVLTPQKIR